MLTASAPLAATAAALSHDQRDLFAYINELCDRIDAAEPFIQAFLPEAHRRTRLLAEAAALPSRFPDPTDRPPLYGVPVGVKDVFSVDGFPTTAGSQLPVLAIWDIRSRFCGTHFWSFGTDVPNSQHRGRETFFRPHYVKNHHERAQKSP